MSVLGDRIRIPTREELDNLSPAERAELTKWANPRIVPEYFPVIPHPPQQLFLWMQNLEVFYGGAGGGGKSIALLLAALQYVDVPGYNALILRRTFADLILPGALMDRARELLLDTPAVPIDGGKAWEFPSGARIVFGYAQYHNEIYRYRSAEFQFCVERGTGVKMADGTSRAIETIRPGDMVATLEGPRPVTRLHHVGPRPGWRVSTPRGATVVGERHRLLSLQGWVSPSEIASRGRASSPTSEGLCAQRPGAPLLAPWRSAGSAPSPSAPLPTRAGTATPDSSEWLGDAGSGAATCCGTHPAPSPPGGWTVPVMLVSPDLPSMGSGSVPASPLHEGGHGRCDWSPPQGWPTDCRLGRGSGDERSPSGRADDRDDTQQRGDVGASLGSSGLLLDDPTHTPRHSPGLWRFAHPYTMEPVEVSAEVAPMPAWASMAPVGVVDCWDLTVAGASHYITPLSGLIHSNCAYDELTTFPENTYRFMFGRLRRPAVPCLTCKFPLRREDSGLWKHRSKTRAQECTSARPDPRAVARYPAAPDGTTVFDVPLRMRAACVDEGDVLTATGWRPIQDVQVGELVESVNEHGHLSLKPVLATHRFEHDGPMIRVRKKNLFMSMTPEHRVLYRKFGKATYDLDPWVVHAGRSISVVRAPSTYQAPGVGWPGLPGKIPLGLAADDYLAFLGLFLAEGCTNTAVRRSNYKVVVTQCDQAKAKRVAALFDRLGVNYSHSANGDFQVCRKVWWEHFRVFGKAHQKFVPRSVLQQATPQQLKVLLDWMVFGDGHVRGDSISYFTVSSQLADDVAEIGVKLGYKVQAIKQILPSPQHRDRWVVYLTKGVGTDVTKVDKNEVRNQVETEDFTGPVYCLTVADNETFVIRQQGKVWVSGNSNPGGIGHGWVRDRFVNPLTRDPKTVFVPARLSDNPSLDAETYVESLDHLDPIEKARILNGDWLVTEAGKLFQRSWFRIVPEMPADARSRMVRYWDLAATEVKLNRDPDWTVGALVGFHEGVWYIADIRRVRATPLGVEQLVAQTAMLDGRRVAVWIEQEPGASGKATIDTYRRRILPGFEVRGDPPSGNKAERARPVSSAAEAGNVCLVEAPWNRVYLDEAELFPTPGVHDDMVDATSGAIAVLSVRRARLRV